MNKHALHKAFQVALISFLSPSVCFCASTSALVALGATVWSTAAQAATAKPLFQQKDKNGEEVFKIKTEKNETPVYRILSSTLAKQTIAIAINSAWNLQKPAGDKPGVEVRLETLSLQPVPEKTGQLAIKLVISGREIQLEPTIKRADLEAGKSISVQIPKRTEEINLLKLNSEGSFNLQYKKSMDLLFISNAKARAQIETPLGDDESETIEFNGHGVRQTK